MGGVVCRDEGVEVEEGNFGAGEERGGLLVFVRLEGLVELLEHVSELLFGHGGR